MASSKKITITSGMGDVAGTLRVPTTGLWMLAIFVLGLLPRVLPWGTIVTVDEAYHWFSRAGVFLRAVQNGAYADTNLVGHPGVTTMWLGALGIMLQRALVEAGWASYDNAALYRGLLRLPVAIVAAGSVALAYPLLRRLVDPRVALVGALFWAVDPFLIAHSQLLHLDALLTSFITLSLLAAIGALSSTESVPGTAVLSWPLLIASAIAGGMALLTKSPSVILLPMVGLIALVGAVGRHYAMAGIRSGLHFNVLLRWILLPLAAWITVAAIVWVALWPAAWVDLPGAIGRVVAQARDDGGVPHAWGNFFLGRPVADPGPLFYPVVIALRLAPWSLVGCVAALIFLLRRDWRGVRVGPLVLLAFFALVFVAAMSVPPKKFDRYILPVFPTLDLFAAAGLVRLVSRQETGDRRRELPPSRFTFHVSRFTSLAVCQVGLWALVAVTLVWYYPYYLSFYNPLFGGGRVAARLIPIGWGEGYEQVAQYLAAQPDGEERPIAAWFPPVLSMFLPSEIGPLRWALEPGKVDYAVLYIDQVQRDDEPEATAYLRQSLKPVHTVRIHGIDYAEIYRIPPPVANSVTATFGDGIALRGYDTDASALRRSGIITMTLDWQAAADIPKEYMLFIHILDDHGKQVGQADVPPGGAQAPTSSWRSGRYLSLVQPVPTQGDIPPGRYWLAVGLYDPQSFGRLPLRADPPPPGAPSDGEHALVLGPVEIVP